MLLLARTGGVEDPIWSPYQEHEEKEARWQFDQWAKDLNRNIHGDRVDLLKLTESGEVIILESTG